MHLLYAHIIGGVDYDSGPYTVTFTAGQTSASFDIPINDNNILETNEDFTITINSSSLPNGVTRDIPGTATVTIMDDDGIVILTRFCVSPEMRLYVIAREFVTSLLISLSMGSKQV